MNRNCSINLPTIFRRLRLLKLAPKLSPSAVPIVSNVTHSYIALFLPGHSTSHSISGSNRRIYGIIDREITIMYLRRTSRGLVRRERPGCHDRFAAMGCWQANYNLDASGWLPDISQRQSWHTGIPRWPLANFLVNAIWLAKPMKIVQGYFASQTSNYPQHHSWLPAMIWLRHN